MTLIGGGGYDALIVLRYGKVEDYMVRGKKGRKNRRGHPPFLGIEGHKIHKESHYMYILAFNSALRIYDYDSNLFSKAHFVWESDVKRKIESNI